VNCSPCASSDGVWRRQDKSIWLHGSNTLYRLFEFRAAPRLFELPGAVENHCLLDPSTFSASFR